MVASSRAAGVAEDENLLAVRHEGVGLNQVAARGSPFDALPADLVAEQAPRTARDFGDAVGAEIANDFVERARDGGHR